MQGVCGGGGLWERAVGEGEGFIEVEGVSGWVLRGDGRFVGGSIRVGGVDGAWGRFEGEWGVGNGRVWGGSVGEGGIWGGSVGKRWGRGESIGERGWESLQGRAVLWGEGRSTECRGLGGSIGEQGGRWGVYRRKGRVWGGACRGFCRVGAGWGDLLRGL